MKRFSFFRRGEMSSELCHTSFHFLHTPKAPTAPPATPATTSPPAVPEAVAWPLIRTHRSSYKKDKWEQPLHRENMSSTKSRILYHQFSGCHSELFAGCFLSFFVIAVCYKLLLQSFICGWLLGLRGYCRPHSSWILPAPPHLEKRR